MAPKDQPAQPPRSRECSPELGDPSLVQQYNQHGRPIRRSAGKRKSLADGFVDSAVLEEDDDDPIEMPSEDEDGQMVSKLARNKRQKRARRSPSPAPPPLEPIIYDEDPGEPSDDDEGGVFHHKANNSEVTLQFNIPLAYHGPLRVTLDHSVLAAAARDAGQNIHPPRPKKRSVASAPQQSTQLVPSCSRSFTTLPGEIRNRIYGHLFVAGDDLKFQNPRNFCRSAQFLRTCRMVHSEGCSVLYGRNRFVFERNRHQRAAFWEPQPKEIGYKDVRQFLKMIGLENLNYIRNVKIIFEDSSPAATPYLPTHESRRFIHDEQLIECLRILRQARLQKVTMHFAGRRTLSSSDVKFLGYLERIKADEVSSEDMTRPWYSKTKIESWTFKDLKESMTRKKKLFPEIKKEDAANKKTAAKHSRPFDSESD